jgi:DNA-directed RNA polymerase specialized sigma24 family protein
MATNQKNEIDLLQDMNRKLDTLIAITAIQGKERDEKVMTLAGLGFTNVDICQLLGIPKGTVDTIRAKKAGGKK